MSPRLHLIISASPLVALLGIDVVLDVINRDEIPIRAHMALVAILAVVSMGAVLGRMLGFGVELGQQMRPTDLEDDTGSVVVPLTRAHTHRVSGRRRA